MENQKSTNFNVQSSQLMKLFKDELKEIYWAEKAFTKVIPKMIKNTRSQKLIHALKNHLAETENQLSRVEQIVKALEKKVTDQNIDEMEDISYESGEIIDSCEDGSMCEPGITWLKIK